MPVTSYMQLFSRVVSVKYDGTNSALVMTMLGNLGFGGGYTLAVADANHMVCTRVAAPDLEIPVNMWATLSPDSVLQIVTESEMLRQYKTLDQMAVDLAGATPAVIAIGVGTVPAMLLNAQATVQVTIAPAFANTSYNVATVLSSQTGLLANVSIVSSTKVSGSRVDVVVKNTGLASLAGTVLVAAVAG